MNRIVLGALAALLLVASGLFWWQGRAEIDKAAPPPVAIDAGESAEADADGFGDLPDATGQGLKGSTLPRSDPLSREEKRFNRLDRDRDGRITRNEMLGPRVNPFRKLDRDGNNLLSFEEWSLKTTDRFRGADGNRDGSLTRQEFVTTRPKPGAKPECRCSPIAARRGGKQIKPVAAAEEESEDDGGDPAG